MKDKLDLHLGSNESLEFSTVPQMAVESQPLIAFKRKSITHISDDFTKTTTINRPRVPFIPISLLLPASYNIYTLSETCE